MASVIVGWIGYGLRKPALAVGAAAAPAVWFVYMVLANLAMESAPRQ